MAHQALYREWRPKTFDEVVEQKTVVYALRQSVISGQIAHAYLFSGTRGTGKTTVAKIFSRAINCLHPDHGNPDNQCEICRAILDGSLMDVVEMDAASNNSVDNIRRICDEVIFMPSQARFKVYIVDEVHMLSSGAFNALLKTLEEPPAHAVFILATTEPHRIPATILSRCQRYEFRRLPVESMVARLAEIASAGGIDASPEALRVIASLSDGALRDAISLLDQARASFPGRVESDDVLALAGVVQDVFMQQMAASLLDADAPSILALVDQLIMAGRDLARFVTDLAQYLRNVLICQISENPQLLVRVSADTLDAMRKLARKPSQEQILDLIRGLSALLSDLRWASDSRTALEIGLIRLMDQAGKSKACPPEQNPQTGNHRPPAAKLASTPLAAVTAPAASAPPAVTAPAAAPAPADTLPVRTLPLSAEASLPVEEKPAADATPDGGGEQPGKEPGGSSENTGTGSLWAAMLDELVNEGHMTLYLFSRSAQPQMDGKTLQLMFALADQVNYRETSQPGALKILGSLATRLSGKDIQVKAGFAQEAEKPARSIEPAGDDWIGKIKKTADHLGIPVKLEE